MTENGQHETPLQPEPLVSGHLSVYQIDGGQGLLCFKVEGSDEVTRQEILGMMVGPLVAMLTGGEVTLDMDGKSGRMLRGVAKVMGLG